MFYGTSSKLRSSESCLRILIQSPGVEHLDITGARLPTYEQVLLCYMSNMDKFRADDAYKNMKLSRVVSKVVIDRVIIHYQKAVIATKQHHKMAEGIEKIQSEFVKMQENMTLNRIQEFRQKLNKTMPFWTRNTINEMGTSLQSSYKSLADKKKLETDLKLLRRMMGDRSATYASMDMSNAVREENQHARQVQEESRKNTGSKTNATRQFIRANINYSRR